MSDEPIKCRGWVLTDKVYHEHEEGKLYPINNFRCTDCGAWEPRALGDLIRQLRVLENENVR